MKEQEDKQIRATRRMLAELAEMAEASSMTGALKGGTEHAARAYNGALRVLTERGLVPVGMFEPLDVDRTEFGQIGVQCRLLMAAIAEEDEPEERNEGGLGAVVALAPFLDSQDLAQLVRERMEGVSRIPDGLLAGLAPFMNSNDLGELVRRRARPSPPPTPPTPPPPPAPPTAVVPVPEQDLRPAIPDPQPAELERLAAELRRPDLTVEERQQIAIRLAELAYAQSTHVLE